MIPAVASELAAVIAAAAPEVTVLDHVPITPPVPCIWVEWPSFVNFELRDLAGQKPATVAIVFAVGLGDGRTAQVALGELMHDTVPAALEAHTPVSFGHLKLKNLGAAQPTEDRHLQAPLNIEITY